MAGMGKRAARSLVDAGVVSWDDLRVLLDRVAPEELALKSRVNETVVKRTTHRVFTRAIAGRTGPVHVWEPDTRGDMQPAMDRLLAVNVLRDFAAELWRSDD